MRLDLWLKSSRISSTDPLRVAEPRLESRASSLGGGGACAGFDTAHTPDAACVRLHIISLRLGD